MPSRPCRPPIEASQVSAAGASALVVAAALSALAALAHVGVVIGGPAWYRFFGAGEGMARLAASGSIYPAAVTLGIAGVLAVWSLYALSGAGLVPPLPFLRTVLVAVTGVYLLRGLAGFVLAAVAPGGNSPAFWAWSSAICLLIGAVHAFGLVLQWPRLAGHQAAVSAEIARQFEASGRGRIDLAAAGAGDWDRVCVLGPYASDAQAARTLGFAWPAQWATRIHHRDDVAVLLFVKGRDVQRYVAHPRSAGDFARQGGRCFARGEAIFQQVDAPPEGSPGLFLVHTVGS